MNQQEQKLLVKIYKKLGEQGLIISSIPLIGDFFSDENMPPILFGILSTTFIASQFILIKGYLKEEKIKTISFQKENVKVKKKK